MDSHPSSEVSVYSTTYNHGQPDFQQAKQIRQETFQRYATTQLRRSQIQKNDRSFNVASCLVWNNTENENNKIKDDTERFTTTSRYHFNDKSTRNNQQKRYQSQSMRTLNTIEPPRFGMSATREHYTAKVIPPLRSLSSCEQTHTNSVECLISKYM